MTPSLFSIFSPPPTSSFVNLSCLASSSKLKQVSDGWSFQLSVDLELCLVLKQKGDSLDVLPLTGEEERAVSCTVFDVDVRPSDLHCHLHILSLVGSGQVLKLTFPSRV